MLAALEGKLLVGSVVREKKKKEIDFSYLPVVGTNTVCPFEGF